VYLSTVVKFGFSDETGMWVRVSNYVHPDPAMPAITLLPMIHIGEKEFFREINHEMWRHDTAYLEGSYMPARKLFHTFHRVLGNFSNLSLQSGKLPLWKKWKQESRTQGKTGLTEVTRKSGCDCGVCYLDELRTVRADLHRWHALKAFKVIPLWAKLTFPLIIVAAIIASPFINFRDHVLDDEDCDCCENCDDDNGFFENLMAPFWQFAIDDRDLFLRMVLAEEILKPRSSGKSICVKYGEKHMSTLAETLLHDFGYELANQRDVLAVKKRKDMDISDINAGYGYAVDKYWEERDAKWGKTKELVTELVKVKSENVISLGIRMDGDTTPISYSVQTDLSEFVGSITPADAA